MEGLVDELKRNRTLLGHYEEIGPAGAFGAALIKKDIEDGERAIKEGDTVEMLRVFKRLQGNE